MSTLYLVALGGFCVVMLGVLLEAAAGVSKKPVWHAYRAPLSEPANDVLPRVAQTVPAVKRAGLVDVPVAAVEARHSNFAGLTNNDKFEQTA